MEGNGGTWRDRDVVWLNAPNSCSGYGYHPTLLSTRVVLSYDIIFLVWGLSLFSPEIYWSGILERVGGGCRCG